MYNPSDSSSAAGGSSGGGANRNARYAYLVGRLRTRQITMEEATELFTVQQAALTRSESARLAALAQASATSGSPSTSLPVPLPPPPASPVAGSTDDFFILGLLAMGAGAGLMAAMARKMQDTVAPATPPSKVPPSE